MFPFFKEEEGWSDVRVGWTYLLEEIAAPQPLETSPVLRFSTPPPLEMSELEGLWFQTHLLVLVERVSSYLDDGYSIRPMTNKSTEDGGRRASCRKIQPGH